MLRQSAGLTRPAQLRRMRRQTSPLPRRPTMVPPGREWRLELLKHSLESRHEDAQRAVSP